MMANVEGWPIAAILNFKMAAIYTHFSYEAVFGGKTEIIARYCLLFMF
jgi:hypothetical protein